MKPQWCGEGLPSTGARNDRLYEICESSPSYYVRARKRAQPEARGVLRGVWEAEPHQNVS